MAIAPNIQQSINNFFSIVSRIPSHQSIKSNGNLYELYIYILVHRALSTRFKLSPQNLGPQNEFIFKCSPGPKNNFYSSFVFSTAKHRYELRNGIEFMGHNLSHEIDISIFVDDAQIPSGQRPSKQDLRLAIECKYYKTGSSLKGEVRKYLGAISDLSSRGTNINPQFGNAGCVHYILPFFKSFTTNILKKDRKDLQNFLDTYTLYSKFGVTPNTTEENSFIQNIAAYAINF